MTNDFDTPVWADHHQDVSDAIRTALRAIGNGFERLHDIQWSAPWQRQPSRLDHGRG